MWPPTPLQGVPEPSLSFYCPGYQDQDFPSNFKPRRSQQQQLHGPVPRPATATAAAASSGGGSGSGGGVRGYREQQQQLQASFPPPPPAATAAAVMGIDSGRIAAAASSGGAGGVRRWRSLTACSQLTEVPTPGVTAGADSAARVHGNTSTAAAAGDGAETGDESTFGRNGATSHQGHGEEGALRASGSAAAAAAAGGGPPSITGAVVQVAAAVAAAADSAAGADSGAGQRRRPKLVSQQQQQQEGEGGGQGSIMLQQQPPQQREMPAQALKLPGFSRRTLGFKRGMQGRTTAADNVNIAPPAAAPPAAAPPAAAILGKRALAAGTGEGGKGGNIANKLSAEGAKASGAKWQRMCSVSPASSLGNAEGSGLEECNPGGVTLVPPHVTLVKRHELVDVNSGGVHVNRITVPSSFVRQHYPELYSKVPEYSMDVNIAVKVAKEVARAAAARAPGAGAGAAGTGEAAASAPGVTAAGAAAEGAEAAAGILQGELTPALCAAVNTVAAAVAAAAEAEAGGWVHDVDARAVLNESVAAAGAAPATVRGAGPSTTEAATATAAAAAAAAGGGGGGASGIEGCNRGLHERFAAAVVVFKASVPVKLGLTTRRKSPIATLYALGQQLDAFLGWDLMAFELVRGTRGVTYPGGFCLIGVAALLRLPHLMYLLVG